MKIRIIKCDHSYLWYSDLVGQTLSARNHKDYCIANYHHKDPYDEYTITGIVNDGDYEEVAREVSI